MIKDESIIRRSIEIAGGKFVYSKEGDTHSLIFIDKEEASHVIVETLNSSEIPRILSSLPALCSDSKPVVRRTRKPKLVKIPNE